MVLRRLARLRFLDIANRFVQNVAQVDLQDGGHAEERIQRRIPRRFIQNGIGWADSKVLTKDWLSPALDASMFIERRRLRRAWLNRRATSALICWRAESSTPDFTEEGA